MIDRIFSISSDVRYVAIYRGGELETQTKGNTEGASSSESDKYKELIANPVMLKAATQRGNIDCGGPEFLLVRYGNFFQFVLMSFLKVIDVKDNIISIRGLDIENNTPILDIKPEACPWETCPADL